VCHSGGGDLVLVGRGERCLCTAKVRDCRFDQSYGGDAIAVLGAGAGVGRDVGDHVADENVFLCQALPVEAMVSC